jgi:hypothetical protein
VLAAWRGTVRLAREGVAALWPRDASALADAAAMAWALVACASAVMGMSPRTSLFGEIGQREGVLTTLSLVGLWFGARDSHGESAHAGTTLAVAFIAAGLAGLVALAQFAGLDPLVWENPARYAGVVRPPGTLGNPILLGVIMAAAIAGGVSALARARAHAWFLAPALAVTAAALVATLSRGAWLAAAAGLAATAAPLLLPRASANARGRALLAMAAALVPAFAFGVLAASGPVLARLGESAATGATSSPTRAAIASGALRLWRSHPWLGTGPDTFGLAFTRVQSPELWRLGWFGLPLHAHSAVLQVAATLGAAGVLALIGWSAGVLLAGRSPREEGSLDFVLLPVLVALALAALVNPLGLAGAAVLVVASALVVNRAGSTRAHGGAGDRLPNAVAAVAVLVGALAMVAGVRELSALADAGRARAALLAGLGLPAAEREQTSIEAARFAARARLAWPVDDELARLECDAIVARVDAIGIGVVGSAAADRVAEQAVELARAATRAVPLRAANHQRFADALAARARIARASGHEDPGPMIAEMRAAFAVAEALAPADGLLLVDRARAELSLGLDSEALATASRIVTLYPEAATGHALEGAAHLMLGDRDRARSALRRALDARWEEASEAQREQARWLLEQLGPAAR